MSKDWREQLQLEQEEEERQEKHDNEQEPSIETRGLTENDLKLMIELAEFKEFLNKHKEETNANK